MIADVDDELMSVPKRSFYRHFIRIGGHVPPFLGFPSHFTSPVIGSVMLIGTHALLPVCGCLVVNQYPT